jgi:hypothetical protein
VEEKKNDSNFLHLIPISNSILAVFNFRLLLFGSSLQETLCEVFGALF